MTLHAAAFQPVIQSQTMFASQHNDKTLAGHWMVLDDGSCSVNRSVGLATGPAAVAADSECLSTIASKTS